LRVPDGFEVVEYADSKLANDIFHMTIDPKGRVVVSGAGYIRVLVDEKNQGKATKAIDVAAPREGAQGMLWEGDWLYYSSDGGLRRIQIVDDKAVGASELIRKTRTGNEHAIHAIRRGPDGWLYLLTGDHAGIDKSFATLATSPIKDPIGGCVLRFTPDLKNSEIVTDGYRNPYDMDFNLDGELFTYDSDNERCVSLPWYEPTRFYHVISGGHNGWLATQRGAFWRLPDYAPDVVPPILLLGRGSPTGVACYRHVQFPEKYRGGFFLADWTFGRIYYVPVKRAGASYECQKEVFLEAVGEEGFAPTALAVHPQTGDLFVSIGGRGTRGAVYRIRHSEGARNIDAVALKNLTIRTRSLERPDSMKRLIDLCKTGKPAERLEAMLALRRHGTVRELANGLVWTLHDEDRHVRRVATDAMQLLDESGRIKVAEGEGFPGRLRPIGRVQVNYALGIVRTDPRIALDRAAVEVQEKRATPETRCDAARVIQLALGDIVAPAARGLVWEGYSARQTDLNKDRMAEALKALRATFPSGDADTDREISRTFAMLEDDAADTLSTVAGKLTATSPPIEDFHYLIVLARLKAPRTEAITRLTASALLALDAKLDKEKANRDSHWPLRMTELLAELAKKDAHLHAALLASPDFGRPAHALLTQLTGFDQKKAAEIFLAKASKDANYPWNADIVKLLGNLPAEQSLPVLRKLWGQAGLEEAMLPVLAQYAEPADRDKFLYGLTSPQMATVQVSLDALEKLPDKLSDENHVLGVILALRRLGDTKEEKELTGRLGKYLERLTGQKHAADKKAWANWFAGKHPKLAARLSGPDGVDVQAWDKRLAKIDWPAGDAERGKLVFTKANCASCHSGERALGPDLRGVAGRFSRDDVLTAIIQPSKDISPRYRTTLIETAEGKVYQGLIIYEAVDSLILQTGPSATIRLVNKQIATRRYTDTSLMPAGLLDMLKDAEIADLYAYLKSQGNAGSEKK